MVSWGWPPFEDRRSKEQMDSNTSVDVIDLDIADYDEKEDAFVTWVNNGRSTRLTAESVGIPQRTVQDWVTRYGWRDRYAKVIDGILADKLTEVRLTFANAMHTAASRLLTDLSLPDLTPSDVRLHIELLHKISQGPNSGKEGDGGPTFIDARQVHLQPHDVRPVDDRALATQAIEANIKGNEVRKVGRRGRL